MSDTNNKELTPPSPPNYPRQVTWDGKQFTLIKKDGAWCTLVGEDNRKHNVHHHLIEDSELEKYEAEVWEYKRPKREAALRQLAAISYIAGTYGRIYQ
jgi:hypothetical protein